MWQSKLADKVNADVRRTRIGIWQQSANGLIFGVENVAAVYLAISLALKGGFSVGMVFAYMAYKIQFIQRAGALIDQFIAFRMVSLHLERLSEIVLADEDVSFGESEGAQTVLKGGIELRDVRFRYAQSDPLVLDGVNLVLKPGEHVAITGPSGGGKSTLVKIMLGLVEPNEGEMLVDGMPLKRFGYKSYHGQIAAVLQEDTLFTGTLADNIALFDDAPEMRRIVNAAKAAAIHDDIVRMPMQYETLVGDMGSALSGGQKQRVLIARALYRQPKILILDEGTAHLDIEREEEINASISQLGITRIIVAHRTATVESAEQAYILKNKTVMKQVSESTRMGQDGQY